MNSLEQYMLNQNLDQADAMNRLQDQGLISDNCILPEDVAEADLQPAIEWLKQNP